MQCEVVLTLYLELKYFCLKANSCSLSKNAIHVKFSITLANVEWMKKVTIFSKTKLLVGNGAICNLIHKK